MKRVKILNFMLDYNSERDCEEVMESLVNDGWIIVAAGGSGEEGMVARGFIVLQSEE